jgi:hypothetical protein
MGEGVMPKKVLVALVALTLRLGVEPRAALADDHDPVDVIQATEEIPDDHLLDVGIHIFDPGLPEDEYQRYLLEEKGVYEDVRKSEARFMPLLLKRVLESTGFWGAVRIVPPGNSVDVVIDGTIVTSNGKKVEVDLMVFDSTGRSWLTRRYKGEADPMAYANKKVAREPFQSFYNLIANDLMKQRGELRPEDFAEIRRVSELKFANDLAPSSFAEYLQVNKGRTSPAKLPAEDDPMMVRVSQIRERDHMFIDALNEHYADFLTKMQSPYDAWRSSAYDEQVALDKLNKAAKWEKILGAAAIFGGIMASRQGRGAGRTGDVAILGGMAAISDGFDKSEQAKMQRQALKELAGSFDAEVSEILVNVEGEVLRLTGSVDTQYAGWRDLLRKIFAAEMGMPLDPNGPKIETVVATPGTAKQ